jgi:hypothetical protein
MNRNKECKHIFLCLVVMSCLLWCSYAMAQLTATLTSSPADYRGNCPGVITFNGIITSGKAQTVTYIFTRSDGGIDTKPKTLTFTQAGSKPVSTTWTLGGDGLPYYAGWEAIKITNPMVVTSNQANFQLRCNPPANSVLAAHGNTDWHIDTANEFLFGEDMAGTMTAQHHAPDPWSRTHIHTGLSNTSKYYYDKALVNTGEDTNIPSGIDRTMLFFYAGHGNPTIWNTLGDSATQSDVRLANVTGGGNLRYYWQCSCEVFAHGPETCSPATTFNYGCPDKFSGAADSASMRNVFQRWGPALTADLRMACGGSTSMYCHTQQVDRAWSDYGNGSVANMFLDGFGEAGAYGVVPICITRGGNDITKTPLYDADFTNVPNTSGNTHYYLMYPAGTQQANTGLLPPKIPKQFRKFRVIPLPPPPRFREQLKKPGPPVEISSTLVAGGKAKLRRVAQTGALYLDSGQLAKPSERLLPEREYVQHATRFLSEQNWQEEQTAEPVVTRYVTASVPADGQSSEIRKAQAGVTVQYKRVIPIDGVPIEVLGTAGTIRVQMNNDGAVLNASKQWRTLQPISSPVAAKDFEQARAEATKKLSSPDSYQLNLWKLGYRLESVKAGQEELTPVYQFAFVPVKQHDTDHPPQLIEVSALKQ